MTSDRKTVATMQVTETLSDGLKREYKVVVPASELDSKVSARLNELKSRVQISGFRPGKVPVSHLKRLYGKSAMAEVIENMVRDTNTQIFAERGFKLAGDPKVTLPTEQADVEKLIEGKRDLDYTVAIEILPPIELADFKGFKLTKPTADVADSEIDEAVNRIAEQNRPYGPKAPGEKAADKDRVTIDFTGSIDGKAFEGGSGGDLVVEIGSGTNSLAASPCSQAPAQAASKPGMFCASNPEIKPAKTSPAPAVANVAGEFAVIAARPSGAAITVSGPFSSTIALISEATTLVSSSFSLIS